jgi:DNA helicase-4
VPTAQGHAEAVIAFLITDQKAIYENELQRQMSNSWNASLLGRLIAGSPTWSVTQSDGELLLRTDGAESQQLQILATSTYAVRRGLLWSKFIFHPGRPDERILGGLPNKLGRLLQTKIDEFIAEHVLKTDLEALELVDQLLSKRAEQRLDYEKKAWTEFRWLTHDMSFELAKDLPKPDVLGTQMLLEKPLVQKSLGDRGVSLSQRLKAVAFENIKNDWRQTNSAHLERELRECRNLLDSVESRPLTDEQARAVLCFENRIQVVASAGSGKTSTMVAKAAYAIHRNLVEPKKIVMLAFNKDAAEELAERASKSFNRLGMDGEAVEALTFHKLGLRIIGEATGQKPDIPEWAIGAADGIKKLVEIVDGLKDQSLSFRMKWDLFRIVFRRDLAKFGTKEVPDAWDEKGNGRILTIDGKTVRSQEEAMISDWLFYNGVNYRYEERYERDTVDAEHRQYRPDFFYPDIGLYHEHFALDAKGNAPAHFGDYVAGVEWKRELHEANGTALIETTSHQIRQGLVFEHLASELTSRGIELDPNPDRVPPERGQKPIAPEELTTIIRTFIGHSKSNCLTKDALYEKLESLPGDTFKLRHRMFLEIAIPVMEAWDSALASEGGIDFEDMLNLAAGFLEDGTHDAGYELVMADEFQDASRARARLCRALVRKPNRTFFAVGDDWQSINRFAGADVSVMTEFVDWFGHGELLRLERTFRCPQELCDISSKFVTKNPAQISKRVQSNKVSSGPVIQAFQVEKRDALRDAIESFVHQLASEVREGKHPTNPQGKVTVFVLGRYNADQQYMPQRKSAFDRWVDISFLTVHRSKGSEADFVILPEMICSHRGRSFPNRRVDDPVLGLAMPSGDTYPDSEERRLFYVAITRARRSVAMFTVQGQVSSFVDEVVRDNGLTVAGIVGEPVQEERCSACKQGVIVWRSGKYGEFQSCSNFPVCRYKPKSDQSKQNYRERSRPRTPSYRRQSSR